MSAIVVHGGAGDWPQADLSAAQTACAEAAGVGYAILEDGGCALKAVNTAVSLLEDNPLFDAGRGSFPNRNGVVEMDALIMDGSNLNFGAVAGIKQIKNPILLAELIRKDPACNFLISGGAEDYAVKQGMALCHNDELIVSGSSSPDNDTVGAIAIDHSNNIAAAVSTGGTKNKTPGRVGDTPLVGSGAYADNTLGAAVATGKGENIMKLLLSHLVCSLISSGLTPATACNTALGILKDRTNGLGGLIAMSPKGQIGWSFTTQAMPGAIMRAEMPDPEIFGAK
jgi:beta-aspartyl-peptidase (threonine type)